MARLFGILIVTLTLAACSSGVSNSGAGAAGTNCGGVDLVCTATLVAENPSVDVVEEQQGEAEAEGEEPEVVLISPGTDFGTLTIELFDPLGRFDNVFQGATFTRYDITFASGHGGAPNLGPRQFFDTLTITLSDSTGDGNVSVPLVDQRTKRQFREQSSGSTVYPYVVTVRASGRDIATNTPITVVASANIEIGNFVDDGG